MSSPHALLEISDLKTYYSTDYGTVKAIDGIDLTINKHEVIGLVGESGCGKSTVGLSILRVLPRNGRIISGRIVLDGQNLLDLDDERMRTIRGSRISMIFQDPLTSLNPVFTVGDQIAEAVELHQKVGSKTEVDEKIVEILDGVGIPEANRRVSEYPHQFSGGMRQRVMIAMMLSCNPDLLIADEPTTSLDVTIQAQVLRLMKHLREKLGSSMLLITHDLGIIAEYSQKVAVMYAGRIVESSDVVTIFKNPRHPYTQALLRSVPRTDIKQEKLPSIPGFVPSLINPPKGCRFHPRCRHAKNICREKDALKTEINSGHIVFCWRAEEVGFVGE
ncbi:MAG: ABC transporter ATP-binding protein [Desulfobacterales bacterium]|nr:ABC transporter ATP-binding protein [Desulfobacterales bacterium]